MSHFGPPPEAVLPAEAGQQPAALPAEEGTLVARGMTWRGDLVAAEDVRVAGLFEGTIESTGVVTVERSGVVRGRISGARVHVEGEVEGDIAAARLIRVERTGQVLGDLEARSVSVAEGARVGGAVRTLERLEGAREKR